MKCYHEQRVTQLLKYLIFFFFFLKHPQKNMVVETRKSVYVKRLLRIPLQMKQFWLATPYTPRLMIKTLMPLTIGPRLCMKDSLWSAVMTRGSELAMWRNSLHTCKSEQLFIQFKLVLPAEVFALDCTIHHSSMCYFNRWEKRGEEGECSEEEEEGGGVEEENKCSVRQNLKT